MKERNHFTKVANVTSHVSLTNKKNDLRITSASGALNLAKSVQSASEGQAWMKQNQLSMSLCRAMIGDGETDKFRKREPRSPNEEQSQELLNQWSVGDTHRCQHGWSGQRASSCPPRSGKVMSTETAATVTVMMKRCQEKMDAGHIYCWSRKLNDTGFTQVVWIRPSIPNTKNCSFKEDGDNVE